MGEDRGEPLGLPSNVRFDCLSKHSLVRILRLACSLAARQQGERKKKVHKVLCILNLVASSSPSSRYHELPGRPGYGHHHDLYHSHRDARPDQPQMGPRVHQNHPRHRCPSIEWEWVAYVESLLLRVHNQQSLLGFMAVPSSEKDVF